MRAWIGFGRLLAVVGVVLAASFAGAVRAEQGVKVSKNEKVGSFLTDDKGMTLYVFKKDTPGKSVCAGPCVEAWPLFYSEKITATGGPKAEDFKTITREDGKKQTTYKGMPLYYFVKDAKPGDTTGQGVKEVWFVAVP
jgi:predicted lipoprotein with Yx(FWY)xxD motif